MKALQTLLNVALTSFVLAVTPVNAAEMVTSTHGKAVAENDLNAAMIQQPSNLQTILKHCNGSDPNHFISTDPARRWDFGERVSSTHWFPTWVGLRPLIDAGTAPDGFTVRLTGSGYDRSLRISRFKLKPSRSGPDYSGAIVIVRDASGDGRVIMVRSVLKRSSSDLIHTDEHSVAADNRLYRRSGKRGELLLKTSLGGIIGQSQIAADRVADAWTSLGRGHVFDALGFATSNDVRRAVETTTSASTANVEQSWSAYRATTPGAQTMNSATKDRLEEWLDKAITYGKKIAQLAAIVQTIIEVFSYLVALI